MSDTFENLVRAGMLFAVIVVLSAVVLAVARKMRLRANDETRDAHEIMSNFRDVYERGGLSDDEFRTIRARLAGDLKGEANDNTSAG